MIFSQVGFWITKKNCGESNRISVSARLYKKMGKKNVPWLALEAHTKPIIAEGVHRRRPWRHCG